WVGCGISFELINNPFMQDLFMQLNSAYHPPGRTTLSDGWSSLQGSSIYNYIVTTVDRKEYLVALKDYSNSSNTGKFLASAVVTSIGLEKFAAVVTDSGSNCRIRTNYESSLTNNYVKNMINNENFFINCQFINQIMEPIKICIGRLEAQTATLADSIFNNRYKELNHEAYLLSYYLHPLYHGYGLKEQTFCLASLIATNYWKALNHDETECIDLLVEFHKFIYNEEPYKVKFDSQRDSLITWWLTYNIKYHTSLEDLAIKMFSIVSSQTACEQNFSILKWFYGDRRNRLTIKRVESMAKLRMYWLTEIWKELEHYGKDLTEEELRACANITAIPVELSSESDIFNINDTFDSDESESYIMDQNTPFSASANSNTLIASEIKLDVEDIADLNLPLFNFNDIESYCESFKPQPKPASGKGHRNMDFEASNIVDEGLGIENINI
ncbi:5923_t:CDS:2, partial [Gigaspora margarita]